MKALIILFEKKFPTIPVQIKTRIFGNETVVNHQTGKILAVGESMLIEGKDEDICNWIKAAGGKVWTSTNPMAGDWNLSELS